MSGFHRRVIVDGPFDRTLWLVIETLVRDGFVIRTTRGEAGTVAGRRISRKHVLLEATHPLVYAEARKAGVSLSLLLPCRIAVYELGAQQTAVVVPDAVAQVATGASDSRRRRRRRRRAAHTRARHTRASSAALHGRRVEPRSPLGCAERSSRRAGPFLAAIRDAHPSPEKILMMSR